MTRTILSALWAHWRRSPLQLATLIAGLALATALWSGVQAINSEARASYDAAAATLGEGQFDQLVPKSGASIAQADYIALRRAGWQVSPVLEDRLGSVRLLGIEPLTSPGGTTPVDLAPGTDLRGFFAPGQLYVNPQTAPDLPEDLQLDIIQDPAIAPNIAVADIGVAQRLFQRTDLSRLVVSPVQPRDLPDLASITPSLRLQPSQQSSDIGALTDSFHLNLTAFGLLSFAVGLFIVHSTMGLAFEQRRGLVRTLRALGVPLRHLILVISAEMLTLALFAGALGVALGYVIAALLLPDVAATLQGLYGADVSGTLQIRTQWWLSGLAIAVLGTIAAMSGRIWSLWHMPILAGARPRAWALASARRLRAQAIAALALGLCALALGLFAHGVIAGFALLGCTLIGAALALPIIAQFALKTLQKRTKTPLSEWFWADTIQQLPGLSLALMALLLALSANIGVSTMVSSFRLTFIGFLDQRLAPELYMRLDDSSLSAQLDTFLQQHADETLPLSIQKSTINDLPVEIFGIRVGQTYRTAWQFLYANETPWDDVQRGQAVVINEQLARRANLWVGDTLTLETNLALPIAAVVGDYGNPIGQVILSETVFAQQFPEASPLQFGARSTDPTTLRRKLERDFGLPSSAIIPQATIKDISLQVFERTFRVTGALNVLTLAVAGFALLMSLLTLADLRLPQLAPIWAMGLTRKRLGQLEILRAILLASVVCLCALPLGLLLSWVLLAIINVEAFGWRLPMYLFPMQYLGLIAAALLAAALAALWPALRLMRIPPASLLKVFANDR